MARIHSLLRLGLLSVLPPFVLSLTLLWSSLLQIPAAAAQQSDSPGPEFPGQRSEWHGFARWDFPVGGKNLTVVAPRRTAAGRPWVWHGEFFGHRPAPDIALLDRGFHVVYLQVPDLLGCPQAVSHWNEAYRYLTEKCGFARRAALVGLSRGGLYCYNWAIANPDCVACIYGDAPVCDFRSWPGGKGTGKGSDRDWALVLKCYGFPSDTEAMAWPNNPVDRLEPLAAAGVPLLHVYGDADDVVPWEENTGLVAERYRALGGEIQLIAKPGVGHHPHGLDDSAPIVDFLASYSLARNEDTGKTGTRRLRILCYNIHHAEGVDGRLDVARIAGVIRSVNPDLVALQEVDRRAARSESADQPALLAEQTGMHVAFGANIPLQGGEYGNAILSRFPITRSENHLLPCLDDGEQRGVLECEIALPDQRVIRFLATHLDHRRKPDERIASAGFLNEKFGAMSGPITFLAGDLNDLPDSDALTILRQNWRSTSVMTLPTIPVGKPQRQIDFILGPVDTGWNAIETRVLDEAIASDHRAIFAQIELPPVTNRTGGLMPPVGRSISAKLEADRVR